MHQDDRSVGQLLGGTLEHRGGCVAAPVVGIDRPTDKLQSVALGDPLAGRGAHAPRCPPARRPDLELLENPQRGARVSLDLGLGQVAVADMGLAMQSNLMPGIDHLAHQHGQLGHPLANRKKRGADVQARQLLEHPRCPDWIRPVVEREDH